jgi:hypothetical protein
MVEHQPMLWLAACGQHILGWLPRLTYALQGIPLLIRACKRLLPLAQVGFPLGSQLLNLIYICYCPASMRS